MQNDVPDSFSYMDLLEALALRRLLKVEIEDEQEYCDLVIELAGLHAQLTWEKGNSTGHLPVWLQEF
ncbi:hypothetical protein BH10CYA1_BH10CYA1_63250 [soil metagenome]